MTSKNEISKLCRLCLVKEQVNVPIFEEEGDLHPICLKINACLFLKLQVAKEDKLPKKICDGCMYKLDLLYQFTNTCVKAEKQLTEWLKQCESNGEIANVIVEPNADEIIQNEAEEALLANYELALQQGVFDDNDNTNNKNNETDQINNITSRKRKLSTQEQNIEQDKEEGSPKAKNSKIDDNENHSIAVEQEKEENESFVQQDIAATSTIAETTIQTEDEEAAGPSGIGEKTTKENGDGDGNDDEETTAVEATKKMAKGKNRKRIVLKLKKSTGNDYQKEKEDNSANNISTTAEDNSSIEDEDARRRKQRYDKELKLLGILHPNEEVSVERRIKTRRMTNTDGPTETTCVDEKALKREMVLAKRRAEYYEKKRKLEEKRLRSKQRYEERKREKLKSKKGVNGHNEQEKLRNRDQDQDPAVVEKAIDSNVNLNKEETSTVLQTVQSVASTAAGTASQSFEVVKEVTNKTKEAESEELFKKYEWLYGLKQGFVFLGEPKRVFQNPQRFILHKTFVKNSTNLLDKTLVSEANIIKNAGRPRFTCAICKAKFHAEHELNVHLVAGHEDFLEENPMPQYSCAVCCIKVPPNLYISHLEEHKCVCLVCMFVASEESTLDEHIMKEHANLAFSRDLNFEKPPATPQEDASTTTTNPRNKNKNEQQTSKKNTKQQLDKNNRRSRSTSSDKKNKNKDKEASKRLPSPVDAEQNKKTDKSEDRKKVNDGEKEKMKDEALNNDNKNKDRKSLTIFRCKICKQQFRTEELAKEHYISNHLNIKTLNVNSSATNAAKSSEKEAAGKNAQEKVPTIHQCGVCFQKFASFEEGMLHCQTMHPNDKNNEENANDAEVPELKTEGEEENNQSSDRKVCKDCGATFISEDALKRHQKKHEMEKETQQQNVQQSKSSQRKEEQQQQMINVQQIQQNPQLNVQQHQKNVQQIQANQQKQSLNAQVQQPQVQQQQVMNVQLQQQQAVINNQAVNVNLQNSPNLLYFTVPTVPGGNFQLLPNSTVSQIPFATTVVPSPPTTSVQQVSRPQQSLLIQQQNPLVQQQSLLVQQQQHQQQNPPVQQQSLLVQHQQNSPVQQQSLLVQQQQNPLVQQQQQHQQVIPGQGMQQVRPIYVQRSTVQHQQQPNPNSNNSAGIQKHTIQGVPSSTILQGGGIPLVQQQIQHRQQDSVVRRRIQPSQQKKTLNIPIKLIQQSLQQINLPRQIQSATTSTVTSTTTAAINSSATTTAQSQSTPTNNNNKNNTMVMQRFLLNHNKNLNVQNAKSVQKVNPPPLITMPTIVNAFSLANKEVANTEKKPVGYLTITSRDGVPKNILLNTTNVSSVVTSGAQAVPSVSATSSKNTSPSSSSSHNNNTDINTNNVIVNSNSLLNSLLRNPKSKDDESTKKSKSSSDVSLECIEIFDDNEVEKETTKNTSPILSPASSASSSTTAASSSSTNVRQSPPQRIFLKPLRDLMETPKKPNQAGEENPPLQLKISNNFVKILNTNQPAVNPTKKNLRCAYCKYVFASHERFTKHRNLFGCFVCHYHTCNFSLLKAHAKKDHADMHVCLMCEIAFGNAETLNQHLEEKHKCQPCGINDGCRHSIQQILKLKKIDNPQKRTY